MSWAAVIAAILEIIGPVIAEWLKRWLEDRLNRAATRLPPPGNLPGGEGEARRTLLSAALDGLPRTAFARRTFLRVLLSLPVDRPPTALEMAALGDAGAAAEAE